MQWRFPDTFALIVGFRFTDVALGCVRLGLGLEVGVAVGCVRF